MNKLYISYCTEYEKGWGQRPDGVAMTDNLPEMEEFIKKMDELGSIDCYWRYSEPEEVYCDKDTFHKVTSERDENGVYHAKSIDKSKFFKNLEYGE